MIYQYRQRARRQRKASILGKLFKLILFFVTVTLLFTASLFLLKTLREQPKEVLADRIISPLSELLPEPAYDPEGLRNVVTKSLEGTKGTYAVAIKNLKTGEEYYQNEHLVYETASLYKLWVMLTVYDQLKSGDLKEDTVLRSSVEELNRRFDIASESAELTEGEVEMTVHNALERMITVSHNYPALLLSSRVRLSNINELLLKHDLKESKLNPSMATAYDILKFYEKLYNEEFVDSEASKAMIELLSRQQLNDRIPKYLPEDVKVAHKTGELGQVKHDAGIVFAPFGDYIIVLLSKSTNPLQAAEREALLSRDVYKYFQNQ